MIFNELYQAVFQTIYKWCGDSFSLFYFCKTTVWIGKFYIEENLEFCHYFLDFDISFIDYTLGKKCIDKLY